LDARLEVLGGKRVADRVDCDLDFAVSAGCWIKKASKTPTPLEEAGRSRVIAVEVWRECSEQRRSRSGRG
jgi:sulfite reductase (NADPH) flavoprotein alpha-component